MTTTLPLADLERWLAAELADGAPQGTALLAGHFALFTAGGAALDHLDDLTPHAAANAGMMAFSKFTWQAACGALHASRTPTTAAGNAAQLLVLADDIQFVRPALADRSAAERLGAAVVAHYFATTPRLPAYHTRTLESSGIATGAVLACRDDRWLFSERELRSAAVRRLRAHAASGDDRASAALNASTDGSTITVTTPEHGDYCLVHSGHTTCAGGYVELLADLHERGIQRLIALVPMRCLGPITLGTSLAFQLLGLRGLSVVNVAIPDVTTGARAAVARAPG
jgi:hypothetical protein